MRRLEDAQAAAVVMQSLYEEQVRAADTRYATVTEYTADSNSEAGTYFPELPDYQHGISGHLETLRFVVQLEQAGAAAVELNLYLLPTDFIVSGEEIEQRYLDIVRLVKAELDIPVSVKLVPFFSSLGNFVSCNPPAPIA